MSKSILELTETFVTDILGTKTLNAMNTKQKCFATCYPLSIHLDNNNFKNTMVFGQYKGSTHHTWLIPDQNKDKIIDPTYSQFYPDKPGVYFATKPIDYTVFCEDRFTTAYDGWIATLRNKSAYSQDSFKSTGVDWNSLFSIAIKSAITLNNEIENLVMDSNKLTVKRQLFFCGIFEILNSYPNDLSEFSNIKGFKNLLDKAGSNNK